MIQEASDALYKEFEPVQMTQFSMPSSLKSTLKTKANKNLKRPTAIKEH
jgi:hypothetical protein